MLGGPAAGSRQQQQQQWEALPSDLCAGVQTAAALRAAAREQLGLAISCGVARSKLLARLASPHGKPDGLAVVPDGAEVAFIRGVPLQKVPQLRRVLLLCGVLARACLPLAACRLSGAHL